MRVMFGKSYTLIVGAGLLVLVLILLCVTLLHTNRTVATLDIKAIEGQFIRQLAEKSLTQNQIASANQRFQVALKVSLSRLAAKYQVVLLPKEAVLAGARDMTPALLPMLASAMRKTS